MKFEKAILPKTGYIMFRLFAETQDEVERLQETQKVLCLSFTTSRYFAVTECLNILVPYDPRDITSPETLSLT